MAQYFGSALVLVASVFVLGCTREIVVIATPTPAENVQAAPTRVADSAGTATIAIPESESTVLKPTEETAKVSPQEVVDAYVDAFNEGDIEELSAIYADDVTVSFPDDVFSGKADVMAFDLEIIADGTTVTIHALQTDGDTLTGDFSYANGEDDRGIVEIIVREGKLYRMTIREYEETQPAAAESAPAPKEADKLSFYEEELVGLWSRFHRYDGSTQYIRFDPDRIACKWEEPGGSNKRLKQSFYPQWDVDEAKPVPNKTNRFQVDVEKAGIVYTYDYPTNTLWPQDFTNLKFGRSTSSKVCEE